MLIAAKKAFIDKSLVSDVLVEIENDRITKVTVNHPSENQVELLVPGYIDTHVHGGGTKSFSTTDIAAVKTVVETHLAHGTTTMIASTVTESYESLLAQIATLKACCETGLIAGIHLEGPWLAEKYKGAHPQELLRDPLPEIVNKLLDAGDGWVKMVTIAPEKPGALAAIESMTRRGVMAAIGHTDASYEETLAAIAAGARGATHLFNAMPGLQHRHPGPILALLEDNRIFLELICDSVHLRPELIRYVMENHCDRIVFITDAMAAAGAEDGEYILGTLPVIVNKGIARLKEGGNIAGSTLTLDKAVQIAVANKMPLTDALAAVTLHPAQYLKLKDVGEIKAGYYANLNVLDSKLNIEKVLHLGNWVLAE